MKKLKHDLLGEKYTEVWHEEDFNFNAPHHFTVIEHTGDDYNNPSHNVHILSNIHFQEGAINEHGVNGVNNEDLIAMVITRLEHFQDSEYACRENEIAKTKLEESLLWLRKRTMGREQRGVEGTHKI